MIEDRLSFSKEVPSTAAFKLPGVQCNTLKLQIKIYFQLLILFQLRLHLKLLNIISMKVSLATPDGLVTHKNGNNLVAMPKIISSLFKDY
jgi:hypothetical protein